jgi:type II secretory pathway pseudopilin PulG
MRIKLTAKSKAGAGGSRLAFTLVEVLVGVIVMAMMVASLLGGVSFGFATTQLAREDLRATQILMEKMEEIRLYSWSQITGQDGYVIPTTFTASYYPPALGATGMVYSGQLAIIATNVGSASYCTNMRLVQATVQWTSGHAVRSRSMSSYVSLNGLQNYVYY